MEPGSKSVSRSDWQPEPHQRPITPLEPGPEKTPIAQPESKTLQGSNTQQKPASNQRPLTQQETPAQHDAESQKEPRAQQKSASQEEFLAPQKPAPQQSPYIQRVLLTQQEAASQQGPGLGKESITQQEPALRQRHVAQPGPGPGEPPPAQQEAESTPAAQAKPGAKREPSAPTESTSQETPEQSDKQTTPVQGAKSKQGSLTELGFLTKLQELSIQRSALEWKALSEWVTDSESESDVGSSSDTDSPATMGGMVAQGVKLGFKGKSGYKVMSGYSGTSPHEKTSARNHRHYQDTASRLIHNMDLRTMTQSLVTLAEDNIAFFSSQGPGETAQRLSGVFAGVREQALGLEPALGRLLGVAHLFDLDPETPANGYRSLVHTARCCLAHLLHKSRYVASNRRSIFFRTSHNLAELEAYLAALTQLRALVYYAQRLLVTNRPGVLFFEGDEGLTADFLREYVTLHKGCFYGRCLGFQFTPAIRPFLQTISIGLVSFGEHYKRNETGLSVAASSLFTSGRFAIDPELRGAEFERITQNLDVHFWKAFWNITEMEVLSSLANMASATVRVSRLLSLPPEAFEMPLTADPTLTVTISPPLAHTGPGPVLVRLISYDLREGQDSEELSSLIKSNGQRSLELWPRPQQAPRSRSLIVHFHGGGFVAQTSRSHEPYLKSWAQELGAPIISIDYSLAPEAPFPRALEECFFAYCWAIKHCALLGAKTEDHSNSDQKALGMMGLVRRDTALLLRDFRLGASSWLNSFLELSGRKSQKMSEPIAEPMRRSVSEAALAQPQGPLGTDSLKNLTLRDLSLRGNSETSSDTPEMSLSAETLSPSTPSDVNFLLPPEDAGEEAEAKNELSPMDRGLGVRAAFPEGFHPRRSSQGATQMPLYSSPIVKNPFMSPLLAPDSMLKSLPPVHIVACALDPMLDDSVMLARRLRNLGQPVTLRVVEDLPHGFLTLAALCRETRQAAELCVERIRLVLTPPAGAGPSGETGAAGVDGGCGGRH
ncbi:hormone-sensitive lipase isoform X1 [Homo sapiens]|uniref:Hormone-sensitive lipase n=1 Tax=Homo sapiens TaxID=9606 RepID=M0QY29_HUMAN|nr:hormone-sensitive lipase isoform X1 [Homo sapiens]XP_054176996.1 hormone-sensitive lipase isoform X1 [Homo sapiens]|eukprot:XP_005258994.1 hormone-sensitive lipase isoform X1 [Homo sapiens]